MNLENSYRYPEVRGEVFRIEEDPNMDFVKSITKKHLGVDKYPSQQLGDERVVLYVESRHTTHMNRRNRQELKDRA